MPQPRSLVMTDDPDLLDDLLRLAATAGTEVEVVDSGSVRRSWSMAPAVLVGGDRAEACAALGLPRRSGVVVLSRDLDDAQVWRRAVALGAEHVVFVPDAEAWLVNLLADGAEGTGADGLVVGVLGGRGGAGASTLAAALAVTGLRRGLRTLLVDGDPLGGGIDLVLGGESAVGLRWPALVGSRGRVPGAALTAALPRIEDLTVLSWDRGDALIVPPEAMRSVLSAGARGSDLVVVDLPRRLDDGAREVALRAELLLLVVPAEVRACAAAARVAAAATLHCADVRVVVRGPAPGGLDAATIAGSLGLPLAGDLRAEPHLAEALDRGEPPARRGKGPLAAFSDRFLAELVPAPSRWGAGPGDVAA